MKKLIRVFLFVAVIAVAGYNVYRSQPVLNGMPELALVNVEVLAASEKGCVNKPGKNDGHCATDGIFYLCENRGSKDCVMGIYP